MLFFNSEVLGKLSSPGLYILPFFLLAFLSSLIFSTNEKQYLFFLYRIKQHLKLAGIFSFWKHLFSILVCFILLSNTQAQNIVAENQLTGNPISEWGVNSSLDFRNTQLNGYATDISVNKGGTINFKINDSIGSYTLRIYRLGYYAGMGARLWADLGTLNTGPQPAATTDTTGIVDCSNWTVSATWNVPPNAVSGMYVVKLQSTTTNDINNIVFIVRDDAGSSKIFYQATDATWQAYNGYGGNNLYNGTTNFPSGHAVRVSYNRPFFIYNAGFATDNRGSDWYMSDDYPMIRWLERNGYDVSYTSCIDLVRNGGLVLNHKIWLSNGHDEYWSKEMRTNIEAARTAGINIAFFSGNEVYWKTRWEADVNGTPDRVMVCYKEGTLADGTLGEVTCGYKCDPDPTVWTGLWRMGAAYDAPLPENALSGNISWDQPTGPGYGVPILVPDFYKSLRFWRNTSIATLPTGQTGTLAPNVMGYEFDFEQFPSTYPHGRITMSSTVLNSHTNKISLYRNGGGTGPWVFGAGTVQWAWGLDDQHFGGVGNLINKDMQQATVNLFADMGVQPGSLQSNLVPASASTDATPPTSAITSPSNGATIPISSAITISGTAVDAGGGVVAGVEVSTDNGTTWMAAVGGSNWTFTWDPLNPGTYTIKCRAYDDSGNMQDASSSTGPNVITVTLGNPVCPCHIFTTQLPVSTTNNDKASQGGCCNPNSGMELGVKFQSAVAGYISGIRFYKTAGNTGMHIGQLYDTLGNLVSPIASATFTNETATGWQSVSFSSPVAIKANTTYVAAYFSAAAFYVEDNFYFSEDSVINSPLIALADGADGPNGVYVYSNNAAFPNQAFDGANYWVDVTFEFTNAPTANAGSNQTITLPADSVFLDGSQSTGATTYLWTQFSGPSTFTIKTPNKDTTSVTGLVQGVYVFQLSINGGSSTSQVTITVNPVPPPVADAGPTQTVVLPVPSITLDGSGSTGVITSYSWSFISGPVTPTITTPTTVTTTVTGLIMQGTYVFQLSLNAGAGLSQVIVNVLPAGTTLFTIFTTQTPTVTTGNDNNPLGGIELGVKFQSSVSGLVTGARFYKTTGNTGTHIGELYADDGTRLAQATFVNETATGWQTVYFNNPVVITANTTYIAAYFSSAGNYIGQSNFFFSPGVLNPPLTGLANGVDGPNGVYNYSTVPIFPNNSGGNSANYWVDVTFAEESVPLPVQYVNFSVAKQGANVQLNWTTANEENNRGFEIQRSSDGANWVNLGFVPGVGNSQTAVNYQYTDIDPGNGTFYYRLQQTDYDGHTQLSKVVQVSFDGSSILQLLQNHPNPFNNSSIIDIVIPRSCNVQLIMYDQMGRPVQNLLNEFKMPGTYHIQVNRNGLSSGIYYYKLNALGQSIVQKMTIM